MVEYSSGLHLRAAKKKKEKDRAHNEQGHNFQRSDSRSRPMLGTSDAGNRADLSFRGLTGSSRTCCRGLVRGHPTWQARDDGGTPRPTTMVSSQNQRSIRPGSTERTEGWGIAQLDQVGRACARWNPLRRRPPPMSRSSSSKNFGKNWRDLAT